MAWVEIGIKGTLKTVQVPETLYNTLYKNNEAFELIDAQPQPIKQQNKENVEDGSKRAVSSKGTKKVSDK